MTKQQAINTLKTNTAYWQQFATAEEITMLIGLLDGSDKTPYGGTMSRLVDRFADTQIAPALNSAWNDAQPLIVGH